MITLPAPAPADDGMTAAHSTVIHRAILETFPSHEPRETDVHYHIFNETRARLKRLGKLVCWIGNADCDHTHPIELHHDLVEFALAKIVDVDHFRQLYPEFGVESDEDFLAWVESEGNLLPLCKLHHTGILGIHVLSYPGWRPQRFMKAGALAPERKVS